MKKYYFKYTGYCVYFLINVWLSFLFIPSLPFIIQTIYWLTIQYMYLNMTSSYQLKMSRYTLASILMLKGINETIHISTMLKYKELKGNELFTTEEMNEIINMYAGIDDEASVDAINLIIDLVTNQPIPNHLKRLPVEDLSVLFKKNIEWTFANDIKDDCGICLSTFKSKDRIGKLECFPTHVYHQRCLYSMWKDSDDPKCPYCKECVNFVYPKN